MPSLRDTRLDPDRPVYSIGSVARMLEVSVQTLRLYEAEGLIVPGKSAGGQRRYSESDIRRLECIREAINKEKMTIAGIRRMQALVPCWSIVKCTPDQRDACPAFREHDGGCWTYKHDRNPCAARECRTCDVYRLSTTCEGIKQIISKVTSAPSDSGALNEKPAIA